MVENLQQLFSNRWQGFRSTIIIIEFILNLEQNTIWACIKLNIRLSIKYVTEPQTMSRKLDRNISLEFKQNSSPLKWSKTMCRGIFDCSSSSNKEMYGKMLWRPLYTKRSIRLEIKKQSKVAQLRRGHEIGSFDWDHHSRIRCSFQNNETHKVRTKWKKELREQNIGNWIQSVCPIDVLQVDTNAGRLAWTNN